MALWRNKRFVSSLQQQTRGEIKLKLGDGVLHDLTLYRMLRLFHYTPVSIFCERRYTDIKEKVDEWQFFRKPSGHIAYNKKCLHCKRKCKQSYRVEILRCLLFDKR